MEVKMDDFLIQPFEKILSYLDLEDRIKARAVSRSWRLMFDFKVKSLCYSENQKEAILGNRRLVSGAFAQNFINSTRFQPFFNTFGNTILSNLKHLRLCCLKLQNEMEAFARTLNSFSQLEELGIFHSGSDLKIVLEPVRLTLPELRSIRLEDLGAIRELTLDAPKLQEIRLAYCDILRLEIVHGDLVERLFTDDRLCVSLKTLKNLKLLYSSDDQFCPTFLSGLEQLKEIHLTVRAAVPELFKQKQQYKRADLMIYLWGLPLNGPNDPAIDSALLNGEAYVRLAENHLGLADEILLYTSVHYSAIVGVPRSKINLLFRFVNLEEIIVDRPVQDIERFLSLLESVSNIATLRFLEEQPQDLFDRLPEHCAVQKLTIYRPVSDLGFLFRLKELLFVYLFFEVGLGTVQKVFEGRNPVLRFSFYRADKMAKIEIDRGQFWASVGRKKRTVRDLNAAIEFVGSWTAAQDI